MLKFFRLPFATTGDKTAVPDAVDSNGNVSYSQGYGFDYQRQKTDPAAKNIERDKMNQIFFDMTTAIAEIQSQGIPDYITSALNGGSAFSYGQYAVVRYSGDNYISLVAANTALPSDATKWAPLPNPARLQQAAYMSAVAGGTVDAITAAFAPAIAALPAAPGTLSVFVRASGANATTTPTFKADATTAKTIVKGNNLPLAVGDIAGAGMWLELQYDATLDKWVLQNPARGLVPPGFSQLAIVTATGNFTVPAGVYLLDVELWGGGGGGGGSGSGGGTSGGGGAGGYARGIFSVTPGQVIACTIGAAGSGGGAGGAGSGGGSTSFGALMSATGGGGGQPNPGGNAGSGGTGTGGTINITSSAGSTGAASNVRGGAGASAAFGGGGGGGAQGAAGAGAVPGGGGGGGGSSSPGGAGGRGQIHVRY